MVKTLSSAAFEPRKTPVQQRSTVTIEAISEATIQVLLAGGLDRLTTTRVAERVGVSVGTLYQYYPNKQALLFAVLKVHSIKVAEAVEGVCRANRGAAVKVLVVAVVELTPHSMTARARFFSSRPRTACTSSNVLYR
jgi:AcrR family transcriptional regulator